MATTPSAIIAAPLPAWTVGKLLTSTTEFLAGRGIDESRLAAEILLAHVLGWPRIQLYARFDVVPAVSAVDAFRDLVRRAAKHEPVAYLVGHREFFSLRFDVTPAVLIPRPETETLVERAVAQCKVSSTAEPTVWDLGTGSGCIVVTMLTQWAAAKAVATDVSAEALEVARSNAERHGVADRISFAVVDGLELPAELRPAGGFEVLVSNPPYVGTTEFPKLAPTVRDFEPRGALTSGEDGLAFFRRIASGAGPLVRVGGDVFVEIGAGQRDAVLAVFEQTRRFAHRGTYRGKSDGHDRVLHFVTV